MSRAPRDRESVVVDVLIWIAIVNSLLVLLLGVLSALDVLAQKRSGHGEERHAPVGEVPTSKVEGSRS